MLAATTLFILFTSTKILLNADIEELIRYPFTFLCSWLRLQYLYNFVGTRISSMLVDYLLPIKGASSSIYIPAWVVVDQVDLCPRSFTQQETAPAVQRSGQRPNLNLEFLWKFVTSRMLIKKVSGGAGLICNIVVAL